MKKISRLICLFPLLLSFSLQAEEGEEAAPQQVVVEVQEVKYVTDKLRLSLYKQASDRSGNIKLLTSGDKLELLERSGNYARVRTPQGLIGWVKNGFLVSEPTASFLLIEEVKKNEILASQLEKYANTQKLVEDYESTISLMKTDHETVTQDLETTREELEQTQQSKQQLEEELSDAKQGKIGLQEIVQLAQEFWFVIAIFGLVLILGGYIVGRKIVEAKVRNRFQGMKVW